MFLRRSDSKDEKFPVKIGEIHKIPKKKLCITFRVFGYEYKEKFPSCILKTTFERHVDLLFIKKRRPNSVCSCQRFMCNQRLN